MTQYLAAGIGLTSLLTLFASTAFPQGATTSGVRGSVRTDRSFAIDGARISAIHHPTGFAIEAEARSGRFLIQGLEPGGPYTITVRAVGFSPQRRDRIFLALGQVLDLDFVLHDVTTNLDTVRVIAPPPGSARASGGTAKTISELVLKLPTLNRDLYDFVRLVPQVSTKISLANQAFTAGGVGFRFNNFLINGVSERTPSGGVSNAFTGAKSLPLDAVKEYQVLIAPYDVRYGDFAGGLVNTVSKAGTNTFEGSLFGYGRNDRLAREEASAGVPYDRIQYGFVLGGPIIRDRLHFFIAPELQRLTFPATGPYAGQSDDAERPVPVSEEDLARLDRIMQGYGLSAGSAGPVENGNPLNNVFGRVDIAVPEWKSRAVIWHNHADSDDAAFSRAARDTFSLSTYALTREATIRTTSAQVHTALSRAGGGHNELIFSRRTGRTGALAGAAQPIVRVVVPGTSGGNVILNTGAHELAHGGRGGFHSTSLSENLTLPFGSSHVVSLGAEAERFRIFRSGVPGAYGTWSFASLDALEAGIPERYEAPIDFGSADVPIDGDQYSAYVSDAWQAGRRLSITAGLRADLLAIDGNAPYHPGVDSMFNRRTDAMPRRRVELSPRLGFTWNPDERRRKQLRGGIGLFSTRYPLGWAHSALSSYGLGGGLLRCSGSPSGPGAPPAFNPDYRTRPASCADGVEFAASGRGDVNLLDRNLRMMRVLRSSLAYDARLPGDLVFTTEALFTRMLSDFVFVNLNLNEPVSVDRRGRVMYGSHGSTGVVPPDPAPRFAEVIDLRNTSRNRARQITVSLEKELAGRVGGSVSYTHSRVRDVQTPSRVNTRGTVTWTSARVVSGRHDDFATGISSNDIPHRLVVSGSYGIPWSRMRTEFSFYYVGESGRPFTYIAFGSQRRGDLNADGVNNDPVYVPRSAFDTSEVMLAGTQGEIAAQQAGLEALIDRTSCLRKQRGRILERNSCREPWSNTTIASVRQVFPVRGRTLEAQLDVFNVLNLLGKEWGLRREAASALLEHAGQTPGGAVSQPVFRFNTVAPAWTTLPVESSFQLQLAVRYRL